MAPRTGLEEITPELVQQMAEYFGINEDAALQKLLYAQAAKARETPMPEGLTVRNQYIAPSVLGTAASTIERIRGGQDEQAALAKLQAGILRKKDINTAAGMADLAQRQADAAPPPGPVGEVGGLPQPPPSIPFAETPPWEDPWFEGVKETPKAAKPKPPAGQISILLPGMTMSPNPGAGRLPADPYQVKSPFRGYKQGGVWPYPGSK